MTELNGVHLTSNPIVKVTLRRKRKTEKDRRQMGRGSRGVHHTGQCVRRGIRRARCTGQVHSGDQSTALVRGVAHYARWINLDVQNVYTLRTPFGFSWRGDSREAASRVALRRFCRGAPQPPQHVYLADRSACFGHFAVSGVRY